MQREHNDARLKIAVNRLYIKKNKTKEKDMKKFELMTLPYAPEVLEPVISAQTLAFHHGKHLAAYVNNLNGLLDGSGFENATLEEIVCKATGGHPE